MTSTPAVWRPHVERGQPSGWDPGTVRAVLRRPLYRGVIIYGKTKKRDAAGDRHKSKRARSEWVVVDAPKLRILSEDVVQNIDARLKDRESTYLRNSRGHILGTARQHGHAPAKHLLAGFIQCGCGATFEAVRGYYVCSARRRKGAAVCPSEFSFPVERIDHVFLDVLEDVVLSPEFVERVLDATFAVDPGAERQVLQAEHDRLAREVENLTAAIANGGEMTTLLAALSSRDKRLAELRKELARPAALPDRDVLKAALELRTADWRAVLRGAHVSQARTVLQHLLELPIRIHNQPKPSWIANVKEAGLLVGMPGYSRLASPTGTALALEAEIALTWEVAA